MINRNSLVCSTARKASLPYILALCDLGVVFQYLHERSRSCSYRLGSQAIFLSTSEVLFVTKLFARHRFFDICVVLLIQGRRVRRELYSV